jgi:hypothetical protein
MIVRLTKPAVVKSYRPAEFMELETPKGAVLFAGDSRLDGFMPGYRGHPETTVGNVGFIGLTDEAASEARQRLEALKAVEPEDDLDAIESRRSADSSLTFEMAGPYAAQLEKLEGWVKTHVSTENKRQIKSYGGCLRAVAGLTVLLLALSIWIATSLNDFGAFLGFWSFAGPFVLILLGLAGAAYAAFRQLYGTHMHKRPQALATFDRLEGDRHPDTSLYGWLDLGDVRGVRPVRMANSPNSGALKTYHKHHWGRFALALADGNHLAVSLIDKVKLKRNFEVTRRHFVRGRLALNPKRYDVSALDGPITFGPITAVPQRQGEHTVLYFGGALGSPDELFAQLAALYRQLPRRGNGASSG